MGKTNTHLEKLFIGRDEDVKKEELTQWRS